MKAFIFDLDGVLVERWSVIMTFMNL